ncbi:hypothetical protein NA57DRAFT_48383 [Rhizodiscina lignyota]|uniref:C2 domain-containing protein n=1 Tax=Rhizodiscina lignyota TaxID=1504668 RepID=A0A9P4I202_9PEZI|nr:hypothetical protein NA57DRAFT_48383 [Rhizodiscina lignyota]
MSDASTRMRNKSRVNSLQQSGILRRDGSYSRKKSISPNDVYLFALRVAYLSYLLQPRVRRVQHVPSANQKIARSSTSSMDLLKDFSLIRDSKSTRFPHGFMAMLDTRITGVLMGKEKMPEYNDALVKRTFAVFLNAFKEQTFRKNMEKDRRVEDLLLIFFSNATKELQKGKAPEDDAWKLMVDRHVALFIRLVSSILKDHEWSRDRPELASRLQTLEKKLLIHDQDLAAESQRNGGAGGSTVEVEVPRSYQVKDMPLVITVQRIFRKEYDDVQADIIAYKSIWTEKAALQDLKMYQTNLALNNKKTLSSDDFDTEDAYEAWRKAEVADLSQMMLAIVQSNMELAKETSSASLPQFKAANGVTSPPPGSEFSELSRKVTEPDNSSSYVIDQPVDMSGYSSTEQSNGNGFSDDDPYTYIPPDPRAYYRLVLKEAFTFDLRDSELQPSEATSETPALKLLSKHSTELLSEIALRWRIPQFSRPVLFLDVVREKYQHEEISLDTLDAAFLYVKEPQHQQDLKKSGNRASLMALSHLQESLFDWHKWMVKDYALHISNYTALRDNLLRDLFGLILQCYDSKAPDIGPVMYILNEHINADPLFSDKAEPPASYTMELKEALQERAFEVYQDMVRKLVPDVREECEFYHIIELGKAVVKLCEKIQKRYRKNPQIMGVSPLMTLVGEVLPAYAGDAKHLVIQITELTAAKDDVVPIQDGFDLYREMVEIRQVHANALPDVPFKFDVEDHLQDFVWRYLADVDSKIVLWVEEAAKQDTFQMRHAAGNMPTDDERHSESVIDIFRSFNQSVDQIFQLNWDNDLHYAKFMTAMSKSISMGITRYSEILEQQFVKEMDRLTPEQEASKGATRQEKWMQMAKDAWANKEKIEPFQFAAESLVKLNNIEWATLQLDALSKNMNVDACADVIEKNTSAQQMQQQLKRKNEKYVFTIKIIEGEDLKACDMNGLSDPYVVLGDEYQKRLAKTRVIYSNLNPRWDESVDITTSGPLNIIATIWDHDTLGDHDCVGRTSLKLDPAHFRDYVPREYWLDLDTQGRLLLRVSMEGERDDIRFWFGKGMRGLKRCEREMTRGIVDKLSAYIHHCLSKGGLKRLLNKGYVERVGAMTSWFQSKTTNARQSIHPAEIEGALKSLLEYFDENFAIMKETLTESAMIAVMTRIWKEVLNTLEGLLVPPLSDKPSGQKPLNRVECDVVFRWLDVLLRFFNAIDEETGQANGIPMDVLKSPKYHDLCNLAFFYFEETDSLIRQSEFMASASVNRQQEQAARLNRLSAPTPTTPTISGGPGGFNFGGFGGQYGLPSTRRSKTIMLSRNLGTMRKAKEEKRKEAQAEPSDDMILRILRMRPEAERYLKDRSRQKERLQAAAAAEQIVRMSLAQGMAGSNAGGGLQRGLPRR